MLKLVKFLMILHLTGYECRISLFRFKMNKFYFLQVNPTPYFNPLVTTAVVDTECVILKCIDDNQCQGGKCFPNKKCGHKICYHSTAQSTTTEDSVFGSTAPSCNEEITDGFDSTEASLTTNTNKVETVADNIVSTSTTRFDNFVPTLPNNIVTTDFDFVPKTTTDGFDSTEASLTTNTYRVETVADNIISTSATDFDDFVPTLPNNIVTTDFDNDLTIVSTDTTNHIFTSTTTVKTSIAESAISTFSTPSTPSSTVYETTTDFLPDIDGSGSGSGDEEIDFGLRSKRKKHILSLYRQEMMEDFGSESGSGSGTGSNIIFDDNEQDNDFSFTNDDDVTPSTMILQPITPATFNEKTDDSATSTISSKEHTDDEDFFYSGSGESSEESDKIQFLSGSKLITYNQKEGDGFSEDNYSIDESGKEEEPFEGVLSPEDIQSELGVGSDDYYVILDGHEFLPEKSES